MPHVAAHRLLENNNEKSSIRRRSFTLLCLSFHFSSLPQ